MVHLKSYNVPSIYIDGTLYDFKCTKREGYVWKDVAQILGYYLLDCISKDNKDRENDLDKYEIRRIAFYKARFGEVEYYDVSRESYSQTIKEFEKMFWKYVRKREILKMIWREYPKVCVNLQTDVR